MVKTKLIKSQVGSQCVWSHVKNGVERISLCTIKSWKMI